MSDQRMDPSVYQNAEKLHWLNRRTLVDAGQVRPRWLDDGERFWYRVDGPSGRRFMIVDPHRGTSQHAFDHQRLAAALEQATGAPVDPADLPFTTVELVDGAVEFATAKGLWRCSLDTYTCTSVDRQVPPDPLAVPSPDGSYAVFRREYDLWVRDLATGEELPLTSDGVADYAYGLQPDCFNWRALMNRFGAPHLPPAVLWSPDSRYLLTHRTDQRDVQLQHLVEAAPRGGGRPVLHTYHYAMPGDEAVTHGELLVFDIATRSMVPANAAPLFMPLASPVMLQRVWWAPESDAAYYLEHTRDFRTMRLSQLDPVTGEVRLLVEETGDTRVDPNQFGGAAPIVRVLSAGREVLWYSQRDGWGHLYLYDATSGELRGQVTSGQWAVREILHVDETERVVYFVASGLVADDPYRRQVCRVRLDGSGFDRLLGDDLDHAVTVPPNARYFVDSASTTDEPPVMTVRDWDGRVTVELERAGVSHLLATGWTPPERFRATAADGETDIYGILYRPPGFDPARRYPVVDHIYPGPQVTRVQPCFDQGIQGGLAEQIAALGFVVVAVDGRGTPGRSKAFHDYSYRRLSDAGSLDDHVAATRQLAQTRPWMDLDRVGMSGASAGGYATARALCTHGDFYKVGVAECGCHDQRYFQLEWGEMYDGPFDAETYARSANPEIADRLQGKLLLMHGEMDDNVPPHLTMRLVDRLIAANKDFDLLIVPGLEHYLLVLDSYVTRRRWDYLVRHLQGVEPPAGYRIADVPIDFETFSNLL